MENGKIMSMPDIDDILSVKGNGQLKCQYLSTAEQCKVLQSTVDIIITHNNTAKDFVFDVSIRHRYILSIIF